MLLFLFLSLQMNLLLREYLLSGEASEAEHCLRQLEVPHFHHELVYEVGLPQPGHLQRCGWGLAWCQRGSEASPFPAGSSGPGGQALYCCQPPGLGLLSGQPS